MRALTQFVIAASMSGILIAGTAFGDELRERIETRNDVVAMIMSEEFTALEALGANYRTTKSRTSSGLWQLTLFYSGVSSAYTDSAYTPGYWMRADFAATKWITHFPRSATARLAYATMLLNHAWSFRGIGPARDVKPENWELFGDRMQKARAYLDQYKYIAASDPHWYELMASVARAQRWPESIFAKMIAEGLDREPLFYQTYFAAMDYYAAKWRDDPAALERFAQMAVERTKSVEGFAMYARIYWYAAQTQFGNRVFVDTQVNWATMKKGINDVLKRFPDVWNIQNFALFACMANDKAKTAELMTRVGERPIMEIWGSPAIFRRCKDWDFNRTRASVMPHQSISNRPG